MAEDESSSEQAQPGAERPHIAADADRPSAAQLFTDKLIRAAGVLVYRGQAQPESFLLMKHRRRWDLPKGHVDPGEDEFTTAVRELEEETGIAASDVHFEDGFRFEVFYVVREREFSPDPLPKRVTFYLARLERDVEIAVTEHQGYKWFPWEPPHVIQRQTVDPLLKAAEDWFAKKA